MKNPSGGDVFMPTGEGRRTGSNLQQIERRYTQIDDGDLQQIDDGLALLGAYDDEFAELASSLGRLAIRSRS